MRVARAQKLLSQSAMKLHLPFHEAKTKKDKRENHLDTAIFYILYKDGHEHSNHYPASSSSTRSMA